MGWMIVDYHDTAFLYLIPVFQMPQEILDIRSIGLIGNDILEILPLVTDASYDGPGVAPLLVERNVDQVVLGHPEALHLLPKVCRGLIHVDYLPILDEIL